MHFYAELRKELFPKFEQEIVLLNFKVTVPQIKLLLGKIDTVINFTQSKFHFQIQQ